MPRTDWWVFWGALVGAPLAWTIISFIDALNVDFEFFLISTLSLFISCVNLWGYHKCSRAASQVLRSTVQSGVLWATGHLLSTTSGDSQRKTQAKQEAIVDGAEVG